MELWSLLTRTLIIYVVVFLVIRFMGKREIGKLSVFDLVIFIMIAEIAVLIIEDTKRPIWEGVLPMAALLVVQLGISWLILKNRKLRLMFDGKPSLIISKGKLDREMMRKQRYNLDDLMLQLRENKIQNVADVEFAILETSGKLSILPKSPEQAEGNEAGNGDTGGAEEASKEAAAETPETDNVTIPHKYRFELLPIPLIMDGKVQDENLKKLEKTRFWLKNVLQEKGVRDFKDVFLCTIDHKGNLFVDTMDRKR
ncbi:YetF domain-containing protein [Paenibacillus thailandensis]|uniref:YetF domain-containing protein n=1 Tax=Paenibacillus thailandensis TaxID=393250 RepID=A0ABW5QQS2_9BACL